MPSCLCVTWNENAIPVNRDKILITSNRLSPDIKGPVVYIQLTVFYSHM